MKKLLLILTLTILYTYTQAQDDDINRYYEVESPKVAKDTCLIEQLEKSEKELKKVNFALGIGTTIMSGGYSSQYISPSLQYHFTPRFTFSGGLLVSNNMFGYQNKLQSYAYARGDYQLTDKLTVNGAVLIETSSLVKQNTEHFGANQRTKIMSFGAEYKFSSNFSIGVQFQTRENANPYYPLGTRAGMQPMNSLGW